MCLCDDASMSCPAGTSKWTDQLTCTAKCIKGKGFRENIFHVFKLIINLLIQRNLIS